MLCKDKVLHGCGYETEDNFAEDRGAVRPLNSGDLCAKTNSGSAAGNAAAVRSFLMQSLRQRRPST